MKMHDATITMMPLQPFVRLNADEYERRERLRQGISHYYEFSLTNMEAQQINAVPDGSIDLLFNIGERGVHTYISGTVLGAKRWELGDEKYCFGVRFLPGQGVLPQELTMDMLVNADLEINGNIFGSNLVEQIACADGFQDRCRIFEHAYEKLLLKKQDADMKKNVEEYLTRRITESHGGITVEELAEETHYSTCYLRRIFKQYNGVSPKQFARFIRFQHLLQNMNQEKDRYDLMALNCGYYDEAHMMKEFKSYAGVTMESYHQMMERKGEIL